MIPLREAVASAQALLAKLHRIVDEFNSGERYLTIQTKEGTTLYVRLGKKP